MRFSTSKTDKVCILELKEGYDGEVVLTVSSPDGSGEQRLMTFFDGIYKRHPLPRVASDATGIERTDNGEIAELRDQEE